MSATAHVIRLLLWLGSAILAVGAGVVVGLMAVTMLGRLWVSVVGSRWAWPR